jgi:hypothetical protein
VVEKLTECAERWGPKALEPVSMSISFDVFLDPDGEVEDVALIKSSFHLDDLEACMIKVLHDVSERAIHTSLRRRAPFAPTFASKDARTLLGHPIVIAVGAAEAFLVVGLLTVAVVTYFHVVRNTKTRRPPPPTPQVDEPAKPEPPKPEPATANEPKITDPPPPPPPPPPKKETCEEKMPKLILCSDPKISGYPYGSENAAFNSIKVKGIRKEQAHAPAQKGPCVRRGGFHTRVKRGEDYIASIVGCDCCDDSSGKAIEKQKASIEYH